MLSLATARGERGARDEDFGRVIAFARRVATQYRLLRRVLRGRVLLDVQDNDVAFVEATPEQSEAYRNAVAMLRRSGG